MGEGVNNPIGGSAMGVTASVRVRRQPVATAEDASLTARVASMLILDPKVVHTLLRVGQHELHRRKAPTVSWRAPMAATPIIKKKHVWAPGAVVVMAVVMAVINQLMNQWINNWSDLSIMVFQQRPPR